MGRKIILESANQSGITLYGDGGDFRLVEMPEGLFSASVDNVFSTPWNMDGGYWRGATRPVRDLRFKVRLKGAFPLGDLTDLLFVLHDDGLRLRFVAGDGTVRTAHVRLKSVSEPDFNKGNPDAAGMIDVEFILVMPYPWFVGAPVTEKKRVAGGSTEPVLFKRVGDKRVWPVLVLDGVLDGAVLTVGGVSGRLPNNAHRVDTQPATCSMVDAGGHRVEGVVPYFPTPLELQDADHVRIGFRNPNPVDVSLTVTPEWSLPW